MQRLGIVAVGVVAVCMFLFASSALATTYDLNGDFSNASNPNGVWSFKTGTTLLTHFAQPSDGNSINGAAGNGYWGIGSNFTSFTPEIFKTTASGSAVPPYTNADFLAGDVVAHSTNPGGGAFTVNWTAPGPGTITSYSGSVWYAHSIVTRSNDFALALNGGASLASGTVTPAQNRTNPDNFSSAVAMPVNSGDVLQLALTPTSGQSAGSIAGLNLTVNFAAVPEPACGALALIGSFFLARLRRRI